MSGEQKLVSASVAPSVRGPSPVARQMHWLLATALVAWIAEYATSPGTVAPALVSEWVTHLGVDDKVAGLLAGCTLLGQAIGLLVAIPLISRHRLSVLGLTGLLIGIASDLVSITVHRSDVMLAVRAVNGLGLGLLLGVVVYWLGRKGDSVRAFAVFVVLQALLPKAVIFLVPVLSQLVGHASVYVCLIVWAAIAAGFTRLLGSGAEPAAGLTAATDGGQKRTPRRYLIMAAGSFWLYAVGAIGVWAFMSRYGQISGASVRSAAQMIGYSSVSSAAGGLLALAIGARFGHLKAAAVAYAGVVLTCLVFATPTPTVPLFMTTLLAFTFAWSFLSPYVLGTMSSLDETGKLPVWGFIAASIGAAMGPALFGYLAHTYSFQYAFVGSAVCMALSACLLLPASRRVQGARTR